MGTAVGEGDAIGADEVPGVDVGGGVGVAIGPEPPGVGEAPGAKGSDVLPGTGLETGAMDCGGRRPGLPGRAPPPPLHADSVAPRLSAAQVKIVRRHGVWPVSCISFLFRWLLSETPEKNESFRDPPPMVKISSDTPPDFRGWIRLRPTHPDWGMGQSRSIRYHRSGSSDDGLDEFRRSRMNNNGDRLGSALVASHHSTHASQSLIAIVTPSYAPDFDLCKTLNRSVIEFLPESVKHYIFVDRRDHKLFQKLATTRTHIIVKEDVMPRGIIQIPGLNRWMSASSFLPIAGWLVQQITKIAAAFFLREDVLVMVDSDAVFVRDVDPSTFIHDGKSRLYRQSNAITLAMESHVTWHQNASRLLGFAIENPPMHDYIGQVIGWDAAIVRDMCERLEETNGCTWHAAITRARQISEYLLYGIFVEQMSDYRRRVWIDENSRVSMYWEIEALSQAQGDAFARRLHEDDIALMISSHSKTSDTTRRSAISTATNGRLS